MVKKSYALRLAVEEDIPELRELIEVSVRGLQRGDYSDAQIEAALGTALGVDTQLVLDGTYYVAEVNAAARSPRSGVEAFTRRHR